MGKRDLQQTVNSGLLGLVQSIESCNISVSNVVNDSFAYSSIELIRENIHSAMKGRKKNECAAFISGVVMSGIVYSNSPEGLERATGYEAEKITGCPAGICAGIVLPYLLSYRLASVKKGVRGELLLPLAGIDKYCSVPETERPGAGVDELFRLLEGLKGAVPDNLKVLNIPEYKIEQIASAAEQRTGKLFPAGTALKVLQNAYHGIKSGGGR